VPAFSSTHAYTYTRTHTNTHSLTYTYLHHMCARVFTCIHILSLKHSHAHTYSQRHSQPCTGMVPQIVKRSTSSAVSLSLFVSLFLSFFLFLARLMWHSHSVSPFVCVYTLEFSLCRWIWLSRLMCVSLDCFLWFIRPDVNFTFFQKIHVILRKKYWELTICQVESWNLQQLHFHWGKYVHIYVHFKYLHTQCILAYFTI